MVICADDVIPIIMVYGNDAAANADVDDSATDGTNTVKDNGAYANTVFNDVDSADHFDVDETVSKMINAEDDFGDI